MKNVRKSLSLILTAILLISLFTLSGCTKQEAVDTTTKSHTIVDMAGREVVLPVDIERIAAVGPVPVINTFIFTLGEGDKIVNGLPGFAQSERWKYQTIFAPHLADLPSIQQSRTDPTIEELIKLEPDVVFTMDEQLAEAVANANLNAVCLAWNEPEDVKETMTLVGKVLNQEEKAKEYNKYFDTTLEKVSKKVSTIPEEQKTRVLYANIESMSAPHEISDWWIEKAGGTSVVKPERTDPKMAISMELLLKWDPQIMVVSTPQDVKLVGDDARYNKISAVANKQVYPTPMGAHVWAHRTAEQPLMLMWAAKTFHPEVFKDLDLEQEIIDYYETFYGKTLNKAEVKEILAGGPVSK